MQIPGGVDTGMQIRITGEGEPSPQGGPPGDCYCVVAVEPHALFERDGEHLICRAPITYAQAVLGAVLEIPTLQGRTELDIPPGTPSGEVFQIRGEGLPNPRGGPTGDLLVQVTIEVPKSVGGEEEELLRKLAEVGTQERRPGAQEFSGKSEAVLCQRRRGRDV